MVAAAVAAIDEAGEKRMVGVRVCVCERERGCEGESVGRLGSFESSSG